MGNNAGTEKQSRKKKEGEEMKKTIIFLVVLAIIGIVAHEIRYYQLVDSFKQESQTKEVKGTNDKPVKKEVPKEIRKETPREYVPEKYVKWKDNTEQEILEELRKLNRK